MASTSATNSELPRKQISLLRCGADIFLVLLCGIPSITLLLFVEPHKRGYFCSDSSFSLPYLEKKLPMALIAYIGYLGTTAKITVCEVIRVLYWENSALKDDPVPFQKSTFYIGNRRVHRIFIRLYKHIGYFTLGSVFSMMAADICQYSSGGKRPHFFDVCKPKPIGERECATGDVHRFIANYECTSSFSHHRLKESQLSMYSGHASYAFYSSMYCALYLQTRWKPCGYMFSPILIPIVQFVSFVIAAFSAILNVTKNEHQWTDVIIGSIMGNLIALLVHFVLKQSSRKRPTALSTPAEKTKVFFTGGPSEVTDKDIAKTIEHQEHLQHDRVEKNVKAEENVVKAAEYLEKKNNETYIESREADLKLGEKRCDSKQEARKKEMIDRSPAEKITGATVHVDHLQGDQLFALYDPLLNKDLKYTTEKTLDLQHDQLKTDVSAQKDILKVAEKLETEAHKQKLNSLETSSDLDKRTAALEKERMKKLEIDMAAEAKVREAAEKVAELQRRQAKQMCHQAVTTPLQAGSLAGVGVNDGARVVTTTKTKEID